MIWCEICCLQLPTYLIHLGNPSHQLSITLTDLQHSVDWSPRALHCCCYINNTDKELLTTRKMIGCILKLLCRVKSACSFACSRKEARTYMSLFNRRIARLQHWLIWIAAHVTSIWYCYIRLPTKPRVRQLQNSLIVNEWFAVKYICGILTVFPCWISDICHWLDSQDNFEL